MFVYFCILCVHCSTCGLICFPFGSYVCAHTYTQLKHIEDTTDSEYIYMNKFVCIAGGNRDLYLYCMCTLNDKKARQFVSLCARWNCSRSQSRSNSCCPGISITSSLTIFVGTRCTTCRCICVRQYIRQFNTRAARRIFLPADGNGNLTPYSRKCVSGGNLLSSKGHLIFITSFAGHRHKIIYFKISLLKLQFCCTVLKKNFHNVNNPSCLSHHNPPSRKSCAKKKAVLL